MLPILFEIELRTISVNIYSYIFFSILAIIIGAVYSYIIFRKNRIRISLSIIAIFIVSVTTVIGARLFSIIFKDPYNPIDISEIFTIKFGDFSLFGGLVFGLLFGYIYLKILKKKALKISDELVFPVGIGLVLWRVGCFLNGCCGGLQTYSRIGVRCPGKDFFVHPTQIYEILAIISILMVIVIIKKRIKQYGVISIIFYFWFSAAYSVILFLRDGTEGKIAINLIPPAILVLLLSIIKTLEVILDNNKKKKA